DARAPDSRVRARGSGARLGVIDVRALTPVRVPAASTCAPVARVRAPEPATWASAPHPSPLRHSARRGRRRRRCPGLRGCSRPNPWTARGRKEIIVSYQQELTPATPYVLPLKGLAQIGEIDVEAQAQGRRGGPQGLRHRADRCRRGGGIRDDDLLKS